MDISAGLIGKIAAGGTAVAATTTAGVIYGEDIYETFFGKRVDTLEKNSLGLPDDCNLPGSGTATCTLDTNKLKTINFVGKTVSELNVEGNGSVNLEIKKAGGDNSDLNNYTFIFKNDNDDNAITIKNNNDAPLFILRKDMNLEFKIKNVDNKWSLEKVWNKEHIAEKIGLECGENGECTLRSGKKITIKQDSNKSSEMPTLSISGPSKIKLQRDAKGYDQGLRFNIEGGDINLTDSGNSSITKLEKNESYQIEKDGDKWILTRKNTALNGLNEKLKRLGLPNDCKFSSDTETSKECGNLSSDAMKKIKFSGGSVTNLNATSENFKLKIEKDTANTDVFTVENLRFTFVDFPADVTMPKATLKKGTSPEFKIKEKDGNWSLERAWDNINKLAKKIGLKSCTDSSGSTKCSLESKINLFLGDSNYATDAQVENHSNKKISILKDQEGYNQGFKLTVEEDITLNGGTVQGTANKIEKGTVESEISYEIKEQNAGGTKKWFLSKVTTTTRT